MSETTLDRDKVRLGITPTLWSNDDFPSIDIGISFGQCVSEMALAGFEGCSVGGKYPTDIAELKGALDLRGLQVSEPWVSTYFTIDGMVEQTLATFHQELEFIKAMGGTDFVVAEFGGAVNPLPIALFANRPVFDDAQWDALTAGLNQLGEIANGEGMRLCYHHHMGARCGSKGPSSPSATPRPMPISPRAVVIRGSGHWASDQSRPLDSRATFEARFEEMRAVRRRRRPPPPALVGFPDHSPRDRILERPRPPPPRTPPVRPHRRRLDRKPALPMTAPRSRDQLRATLTTRAALASIAMAIFLVILKSYAAIHTGSVAMLGSLADTALDLLASLVTLAGVRWAAMPADDDHRFGHGKAEALAALAQVVLISISAIAIGWRAFDRLGSNARTEGLELGFAVSLIAIGATFALLAYQRHVIKRTGSVAIETDHVHYQSDLLLNLSVIVALVLDQLVGWRMADPLFGIAIAAWLCPARGAGRVDRSTS